MVADIEEWVPKGISMICYADDTACYAVGGSKEEVRKRLEAAADSILAFMQACRLAANATKTNFMLFSGKAEQPIRVGPAEVTEKKSETLLGVTFNKRLNWTTHIHNLRLQLLQRIGLLKRMQMQLPREVVCMMLEPIFTAKLRYGLELVVDIFAKPPQDKPLRELHALHRSAMKAALGIPCSAHPSNKELYDRTGQISIYELAAVATAVWHGSANGTGRNTLSLLVAWRITALAEIQGKQLRELSRHNPPEIACSAELLRWENICLQK